MDFYEACIQKKSVAECLKILSRFEHPNVLLENDKEDLTDSHIKLMSTFGGNVNSELASILGDIMATHNANPIRRTPFFIAVQYEHEELVEALLCRADVDVNMPNTKGVTPFLLSLNRSSSRIANMLVDSKRIVQNDMHDAPFSLCAAAARFGDAELMKKFIAMGNDPLSEHDDRTPLHCAAEEGHVEMTKYLLSIGADINAKDKIGETPLAIASMSGHLEVVKVLVEAGSDVNVKDNMGLTPIYVACLAEKIGKKLNVELPKYLHEQGADLKIKSPLRAACLTGNLELVQFIINHDPDINDKDEHDNTPLHVACSGGYCDIAALLIRKGAQLDARNDEGLTPLHLVCKEGGSLEMLSILKDANRTIESDEGLTPFAYCCLYGHAHLTKALMEDEEGLYMHLVCFGAEVDTQDRYVEVAKLLKCDPNIENTESKTTLHMACEKGLDKIADVLLCGGADVFHQSSCNGKTALHYAGNRLNVTRVLFKHLHTYQDKVKLLNLKTFRKRTAMDTLDEDDENFEYLSSLLDRERIVYLIILLKIHYNIPELVLRTLFFI